MKFLTWLLVFPFVTLPSLIYSILTWLLLPVGILFSLATGRYSGYRAGLFVWVLKPLLLIVGIPALLYFNDRTLVGLVFSIWMIIYFLSRRFSGTHQFEMQALKGLKTLEELKRNASSQK